MNYLLTQIDGKLPNIALMRLSAHLKSNGHQVSYRRIDAIGKIGDLSQFDRIYASVIFRRSLPIAQALIESRPRFDVIVGGTGIDPLRSGELVPFGINVISNTVTSLEELGVQGEEQDYSLYPNFQQSIGFTQRGCRLKCEFCCVPQKEGKVRETATIGDIWRGPGYPKELLLLDNDFFGQPNWRDRIREIRDGGFKVSFNQGINARCLTEEAAEAIGSVKFRDDSMKTRRIYTAWDSLADEQALFNGLRRLIKYGVRPDQIMVYMLCWFWPGETHGDRELRRKKIQDFGARPYPMPYVRTKESIGYQRWIVRRCALKCSWDDFVAADYRPEKVGMKEISA